MLKISIFSYICVTLVAIGCGIILGYDIGLNKNTTKKKNNNIDCLNVGDVIELETEDPFRENIQVVILDKKINNKTHEMWCEYSFLDNGKYNENSLRYSDKEDSFLRTWKKIDIMPAVMHI